MNDSAHIQNKQTQEQDSLLKKIEEMIDGYDSNLNDKLQSMRHA